jgi:hypothetical protein
VPSPGVARVGEKENAAVPTARQAPAQPGVHSQYRSEQHVVRQDQRADRPPAIPIRGEAEMLSDLDCKKPRLWLWTPTSFKHPLRYRNGSSPSRWREGNFLGLERSSAGRGSPSESQVPTRWIRFGEHSRVHFAERQRKMA